MNSETLFKFKRLFEEERRNLISRGLPTEDLHLPKDDLMDEMDMTSVERETAMKLRLRNREALYFRKINEALRRIREGTFGQCEECGESMDLKRIEARPTATLCVGCKEAEERSEQVHIDGHRSKSFDVALRYA